MNFDSIPFNFKWAEYVAQFDGGKAKSFELNIGGERCYFQYILRDLSKVIPSIEEKQYFDIITPFDYGGFFYTSNTILEEALRQFEEKCYKENIISAFFRFHPLLKQNYKILQNYIDIIKLQEHILIDLQSDYMNDFSSKKRRDINRARRQEYLYIENDSIDNFYSLYIESMKRVNADEYFFFEKDTLNNLLSFGKIFSIKFQGVTVNSIFILEEYQTISYFLGAGSSKYLSYGFNSLLLELICKHYTLNKKTLFLGGGQDGLYQYKKRFSQKREAFYIGKKIFNKDIYDKLIIQTHQKNNEFFPKYRNKII